MTLEPSDPTAVGAALCQWVAGRFGGEVRLAEPAVAISGGLDSYIHAVHFVGAQLPPEWRAPLVARILPTADRLERAESEAATQTWCADQGVPAPRVLAVSAPADALPLPLMLMERVPGRTMLDELKARPWRLPRLISALADLQLRLHAVPTEGWPGEVEGSPLTDARLAMVRHVVPMLDDPELDEALQRAEAIVPILQGDRAVICHGDFHPLNVLVDGDDAWLIDWTDAALGPREGDVARTLLLFEVASIAAGSSIERAALAWLGPRPGAPLSPGLRGQCHAGSRAVAPLAGAARAARLDAGRRPPQRAVRRCVCRRQPPHAGPAGPRTLAAHPVRGIPGLIVDKVGRVS